MKPAGELRRLLRGRKLLQAPGAYDGLTARLIEAAGFPVVYMSGYATAASYGVSDEGIIGLEEMRHNVSRIVRCLAIPVIADADTGYDDPAETARVYESAGVAGIQLEDQVWPKKCGHMDGKSLVSVEQMRERIAAVAGARSGDDMVIVARTDAIAVEGFDSAIDRAQRYAEAGADVLFVEAPESLEQIQAIPKRLPPLPHVYNAAPRTPAVSEQDLEAWGYGVAIYPGISFVANFMATRAALNELRRSGIQANLDEWRENFEAWNAFLRSGSPRVEQEP